MEKLKLIVDAVVDGFLSFCCFFKNSKGIILVFLISVFNNNNWAEEPHKNYPKATQKKIGRGRFLAARERACKRGGFEGRDEKIWEILDD